MISRSSAPVMPSPRTSRLEPRSAEPTPSLVSCRLLLADDHTLLRQGVKALIETYGVTVVGEAGDGREAVRMAEDMQPDVAVIDVMMPLLNGLDVVREIRRVSPGTKSLLLTMHTDDAFVLEALKVGVKGLFAQVPAGDRCRACDPRRFERILLPESGHLPDGHSSFPCQERYSLGSVNHQGTGSLAVGRPGHVDEKSRWTVRSKRENGGITPASHHGQAGSSRHRQSRAILHSPPLDRTLTPSTLQAAHGKDPRRRRHGQRRRPPPYPAAARRI